ncbi:TPA: hypothetical protein QDB40_003526 [Burkholderia vietnamiensis]|nr:hypothetical protein [Burkholderia vietnamiensis]
MSTINDEAYDLHDKDDDLDDEDDLMGLLDGEADSTVDDDEDHEIDSDIALDRFADLAMPHGRRAATWLLVGLLVEAAIIAGFGRIEPVLSNWLFVPAFVLMLILSFVNIAVVNNRWTRHRERMESVLQDAMVWRSDVQQKREDEQGAYMRRHLERIEEERVDALREEMTWDVGPAPAFIAADDHEAIAAYEQQKEDERRTADDDEGDTDDREQPAAELSDEDSTPAVRAWIER